MTCNKTKKESVGFFFSLPYLRSGVWDIYRIGTPAPQASDIHTIVMGDREQMHPFLFPLLETLFSSTLLTDVGVCSRSSRKIAHRLHDPSKCPVKIAIQLLIQKRTLISVYCGRYMFDIKELSCESCGDLHVAVATKIPTSLVKRLEPCAL